MQESEAKNRLHRHVEQIGQLASRDLSEADTRAYLIDPVLRILGYTSPDDIRREVQVPATKEFLDYELRADNKPFAIVEAKAARHSVTDQHVAQCVQYASILGVRWCLITNGLRWALYDAHVKGALDAKRVANVSLVDDSLDDCWAVLGPFSRNNLGSPAALASLFTEQVVQEELLRKDSSAISALRNAVRAKYGVRVTSDDVVSAVRKVFLGERADARKPAPTSSSLSTGPARPEPARPRKSIRRQDLIDAGLLGAVNGWQFWSCNGESLAAVRDRLRAQQRERPPRA